MKIRTGASLVLLIPVTLTTSCGFENQPDRQLSEAEVSSILAVFNADLGEEGMEVSRSEVRQAFGNDEELIEAVLNDLDDQGQNPIDAEAG